uniref:UBA domain-containing protein n=1 Tax=Timema cristinae TaxID=61476 RepID=A0A7R9CIT5_TIMCR|nr:unnamed protein product [Timema cristinae]
MLSFARISIKMSIVSKIFPPEACKKAVFFTDNRGLEEATSWVMEHVGDSDFGDPFVPPGTDAKAGVLTVPLFLQSQMSRQELEKLNLEEVILYLCGGRVENYLVKIPPTSLVHLIEI